MSVNNLDIGTKGLDLIKSFEGLRLSPYYDTVGVATIGYGTTIYDNGSRVKITDPSISEERATALLHFGLKSAISAVNNSVTTILTQNQFDALCCFVYNVGSGNFKSSTLLKVINGAVDGDVAAQLLRWNKAGGVESKGLTRRRQAEIDLYNS